VVVGLLSISPLSSIDRSSRKKKINKETLELNDTIDLTDPAEGYRVFHPVTAQYTQYTFFSAAHRSVSKISHILGHKLTNIRKLK
jgi:hypothetical protein